MLVVGTKGCFETGSAFLPAAASLGHDFYDGVVSEYQKRRDILYEGLTKIPGVFLRKPEGAFYLFPRTPIADDVLFADALRKRRILTVPGSGFYGPGHIRIAYCVDDATILGAIEGFGEVLKEFK